MAAGDRLGRSVTLRQFRRLLDRELGRRHGLPMALRRRLAVVERRSAEPSQWHRLAQACLKAGAPRSAAEALRRVLHLDPGSTAAAASLGVTLIALKQYGRAEEALRAALDGDPDLLPAWQNLGNCLLVKGNDEEALGCFERTVKLRPHYALGWFGKGQALTSMGREREAEECWQRVFEIEPRILIDAAIPRLRAREMFFESSVTREFLKKRARQSNEEE